MVNVPVVIHGVNENGRTYIKKASIHIEKLGISQPDIALLKTLAARLRKVKELVLDQLPKKENLRGEQRDILPRRGGRFVYF